jgi:uncharacterized protein YbjT (DUF2867 family)
MNRMLAAATAASILTLSLVTAPGIAPAAEEAPLVLVAGATGRTGQEVVKQLLAEKYRVRALVRDEAKARELFADTVEYFSGDVKEAAKLKDVARGASYVISALGSNSRREPTNLPELVDYGGVKNLVDEAKAAGVKQFVVVSAMGVTNPDHALNKMLNNIMKWKLEGENYLRASGLPYTIVRPGGLTATPGGEHGVKAYQGDKLGDGKSAPGTIPRADVATVCVRALGNPDAVGKTLEVLSDPDSKTVDWRAFFQPLARDPV